MFYYSSLSTYLLFFLETITVFNHYCDEVESEPSKVNSSLPHLCYERALTQYVNAINLEFFPFRKEVIRWERNKWQGNANSLTH